jgi:hypothetical protein
LRALSPTGLLTAICISFVLVDRDFPDLPSVTIQHRDFPWTVIQRIRSNLLRNRGGVAHCFLIVCTVETGRVDQTVPIFYVEKIPCHLHLPLAFAIRAGLPSSNRTERITGLQLESRFWYGVLVMRKFSWTPSIVPRGDDQNVYLVIDDFGRNGRVYREADAEAADLETVIVDLLDGQYQNPIKVVAFNTAEGWSQDVSQDIAQELRRRCDLQLRDVPSNIQDFVEGHEGHDRQLALQLA